MTHVHRGPSAKGYGAVTRVDFAAALTPSGFAALAVTIAALTG